MKFVPRISFIVLLSISTFIQACTVNVDTKGNGTQTEDSTETEEAASTGSEKIDLATDADYYICYKQDDGNLAISIAFDADGNALLVKYQGQKVNMQLTKTKENYIEGGAHPTIETFYSEIYDGQVNGTYKLSHSGNWDYAEYTRKKDGKRFNFTIDHDLSIEGESYRRTACF